MTKMRFTDTQKWRDPWFMDLPPALKLLWQYVCDNCDNSGVWAVNVRLAEFEIGTVIDWEDARKRMQGRIRLIDNDRKWWIVKFLDFQYPTGLSEACVPHRQVLRLLAQHGIEWSPPDKTIERVGGGLAKGCPTHKDIDRDIDQPPPRILGKGSAEGKPKLHALLAEFGLPCGPKAMTEWEGGLRTVACVSSIDEARAFTRWAIKTCLAQGLHVEHWRHVRALAVDWDSGARDKYYRPAQAGAPCHDLASSDAEGTPATDRVTASRELAAP